MDDHLDEGLRVLLKAVRWGRESLQWEEEHHWGSLQVHRWGERPKVEFQLGGR